jgi:antitoxin component of RelBE/YafQ-DinJ toxin-antitoxin module
MAKTVIQPRVDREVYARFKRLCLALGVPVEQALQGLMTDALERAGIQ